MTIKVISDSAHLCLPRISGEPYIVLSKSYVLHRNRDSCSEGTIKSCSMVLSNTI